MDDWVDEKDGAMLPMDTELVSEYAEWLYADVSNDTLDILEPVNESYSLPS